MPTTITPNLWFDDNAEDAANFYVSLFPNSRITAKTPYTEAGPGTAGETMTVAFELDGNRFVGINGGDEGWKFNEAVSFSIGCQTREELDHYWDALTEGGEEMPCGWVRDRFGLVWQVVPAGIEELFADPDRERATRAMKAMYGMRKLDIDELRRAADAVPAA